MFQLEYFKIPRPCFVAAIAVANFQPDYRNHKMWCLATNERNKLICPVSVISSFQEDSRRGCFIRLRQNTLLAAGMISLRLGLLLDSDGEATAP
jgi:hypothetical protein